MDGWRRSFSCERLEEAKERREVLKNVYNDAFGELE